MLESAVRRGPPRAVHGLTWLNLAALYALYGEDGLDNGAPALRNAVSADPNLASHPLYRALFWEFAAYRGATVSEVKRGLKGLTEHEAKVNSPVIDNATLVAAAGYHAAAALFAVDAAKSAARQLSAIDDDALPTYLDWRRWSLLGQCHEAMGEWVEAAVAFEHAVTQAPALEREPERLSLAGALVELFRIDDALEQLKQVDETRLSSAELAVHRYLQGRAHLELDNPNLALKLLQEAAALDDEDDAASYSVSFATAQALASLGRATEAVEAFRDALALAPVEHRAFTQHEAAYALIECDQLYEAEALLGEVVSDPSYSHRGDALADLADVRLRRGELDAAAAIAEQALDHGATAPACITLGSVAFEYYRLDEAAGWYEQALSASATGDPFWVAAQQMLADVYSQLGANYVSRMLLHAKAALDYTEPVSEWYLPLLKYVDDAKSQLGGFERVLN